MFAFGIVIIVMSFISRPPRFDQLVRVEGPLVSYSLYRTHGHSPDLLALIKLGGHPGRFWNDALKNGSARLLGNRMGARVGVMYQPDGHLAPMDGDAVKSYGLWVDGVEIASARDAVNFDRFLDFFVLPPLGVIIAALGYTTLRKWQRQQERVQSPRQQ
jgi:hypothetical protein